MQKAHLVVGIVITGRDHLHTLRLNVAATWRSENCQYGKGVDAQHKRGKGGALGWAAAGRRVPDELGERQGGHEHHLPDLDRSIARPWKRSSVVAELAEQA